jgi:hypothetical protein
MALVDIPRLLVSGLEMKAKWLLYTRAVPSMRKRRIVRSHYHKAGILLKSSEAKIRMVELKKEYASRQEFVAEAEAVKTSGGLLLSSPAEVAHRASVKVVLMVADKKVAEAQAEAVYVAPAGTGYQVGVELKGEWLKMLEEAIARIPKEKEGGATPWGKDSESLFHAVSKMDTPAKIQLALKGGREERRLLMKDSHYMVHPFILKNPKITSEEVAQFSRMAGLTGEMIKTISETSEWMSNPAVRSAIVKNPKTPANIVQKHIGGLTDQDLLQMSKSENVRDAVVKMARRVLAGRGRSVR